MFCGMDITVQHQYLSLCTLTSNASSDWRSWTYTVLQATNYTGHVTEDATSDWLNKTQRSVLSELFDKAHDPTFRNNKAAVQPTKHPDASLLSNPSKAIFSQSVLPSALPFHRRLAPQFLPLATHCIRRPSGYLTQWSPWSPTALLECPCLFSWNLPFLSPCLSKTTFPGTFPSY